MATKLLAQYKRFVVAAKWNQDASVGKSLADYDRAEDAMEAIKNDAAKSHLLLYTQQKLIACGKNAVKSLKEGYLDVQGELVKLPGKIKDRAELKSKEKSLTILLGQLRKLEVEAKKGEDRAKTFHASNKAEKVNLLKSTFSASYKTACAKAGQKADVVLLAALVKIDLYKDPLKLPELTKVSRQAIDRELNELRLEGAKSKDSKVKGNLQHLEQELKTLLEAVKKKDSMNSVANKSLF